MENSKVNHIVIGTGNLAKFAMYKDLLGFLEAHHVQVSMLTKSQFGSVFIEETIDNLKVNAQRKAVGYAKVANTLTISEDTGFFIPALNNEPGIAVRRWGGKLPSNISDKDWEAYFLKKIKESKIHEPLCYKHQVIAISDPRGNFRVIENKIDGKIKVPGSGKYISGGPLSSYFFINACQKFESDLNEKDKKILFGELKLNLLEVILKFGKVEI